ncbi:hypothetical protein V5799_013721 [Amblyomma americanum]|uniref:Uncharacterized protein n=1 Tax=Amblyomma americanum TaxID=6943 RepID=A0AAQ4E532_AMBAM
MFVVLLSRLNIPTPVEGCPSAECARAIASLHSLMDHTVDPCRDFHTHVCRRWEALVRLSYVDESRQQLARRVSRSLINANAVSFFPRNTRLVAAFHRLCYSFMLEPDAQAPRAEMLRSSVGFFGDLLTLHSYSDILVRLVNLSLAQGVHTVFGSRLLRPGAASYLSLFPGKALGQKVRPSSTAPFDQYLPILVAAAKSIGASLDVNVVLHIEEQVKRILTVSEDGGTGQQELKAKNLGSLTAALDANGWLAALNAHLPASQKLSYDSSISVDGLDSVKSVLQLFESLPNHGVAYLYLNALLDAFRFDYLRTVTDKNDEDIVLECLQASAEAMWHTRSVVADVIFGNRTSEAGRGVTGDVLRWILLSISHGHWSLRWMGGAMRRYANRTLSTLSLHLHDKNDCSTTYLDTSHAAEYLLAVKRPEEFPAMYLRLRAEQQQSYLSNAASKGDIHRLHFFDEAPTYDVTSNTLIVPGSLRVEPLLYSNDVPFEFAAGTLGVLMARELYRAILLSNASGLWTTREESALARFQGCIRKLALTVFNVSIATGVSDEHGLSNEKDVPLTWIMAARTAHEGLRLALQGFRNASNSARYWKLAQRTFFRRFCLLTCGGELGAVAESETVPPKFLCLLSLANMPEFAEAFDCPAEVKPDTVCALE